MRLIADAVYDGSQKIPGAGIYQRRPGYRLWYPDGHCPSAVSTVSGDFVPVHQYHPGNGKGDSIIDPDCLPSGTDLYPADLCFKSHVWAGRRYLCPAYGGLSVDRGGDPDLYPFV